MLQSEKPSIGTRRTIIRRETKHKLQITDNTQVKSKIVQRRLIKVVCPYTIHFRFSMKPPLNITVLYITNKILQAQNITAEHSMFIPKPHKNYNNSEMKYDLLGPNILCNNNQLL